MADAHPPTTQPVGRPPLELNTDEIEKQIFALSGNLTAVAKSFGVHRHTIMKRIGKAKRLQDAVADAREQMKDNVESALYSKALAGDTPAMIFFLKTQAKDRGYVERMEMGIDGIPTFEEKRKEFEICYVEQGEQSESED